MATKTLMNHLVKRAAAAIACSMLGLPAMAGDVSVDIRIGNDPPPPPPVVIVREREPERVVVVREREPVVYESYVVGYRRDLYDADLRLRIARADEWDAHQDLDAARRHEGEIAIRLDEQQALIEELRHHGGHSERVGELHARAEDTAALVADLRKRLSAYDRRVAAAREDFDAAKILHDRNGMDDAEDRIKTNEGRAATTSADLHDAEDRLGRVEREFADAKERAVDSDRLRDAEDRSADLRHKLEGAHDAVYSTQRRFSAAQDQVYVALHDRDESLWLLHRDEIIAGRFEPERCGFVIDLSIWGGRMPRDPEVVHAYCVHDVGYWRAEPVRVEERIVIVDRVTEVHHIREIQQVREVTKIERVERVEKVVRVEDRRRVAEVAVVERKRYEAETVERKTAVAEHRAPKPIYIERPSAAKPVAAVAVKEEAHSKPDQHGADTRADTVRKAKVEETGKPIAANAERAKASVDRAPERHTERTAEKPLEKPVEKAVEKPIEKSINPDATARTRRRDDAPADQASASPPPSSKQKGAPSTDNPRDPKSPRDPRNPRDPRDPQQP